MPVEPPVVSPRTLAEAYAILAAAPHRPLAGGTDLLVQLTGEIGPAPERVVDLWRVEELRGVRVRDGALELGALTTYSQIRGSDACAAHAPSLVAASATIGAAQIQNRGTIGGNVMNASPAGDTLPVLLALDASLIVGGAAGERSIPAAEFWPAYRKTALRDGELLLRVRIPIVEGRSQAFRKVGTRRAQAISKVVLAAAWRRDPAWRDVRIAFGSVAATPIRARVAEAALEGASATTATIDAAVDALRGELHPIDDVRSTGAYRLEVSGRILRRILEDAG
jgi:xanthine dehydrogenase small subunit